MCACFCHASVYKPIAPSRTTTTQAELLRQERTAQELQGATFAPEITALAKALCGGGADPSRAWQRLSVSKKTKTLERLEELRQAREETEVSECTFRPRINRWDGWRASPTQLLRYTQVLVMFCR